MPTDDPQRLKNPALRIVMAEERQRLDDARRRAQRLVGSKVPPLKGLPDADMIRRLRFEARMSQAEVARRAGVNKETMTRLERGDGVRADTIERVLKAVTGTRLADIGPEIVASLNEETWHGPPVTLHMVADVLGVPVQQLVAEWPEVQEAVADDPERIAWFVEHGINDPDDLAIVGSSWHAEELRKRAADWTRPKDYGLDYRDDPSPSHSMAREGSGEGETLDVSGHSPNQIPVIAEGSASPQSNLFWEEDGLRSDVNAERISRPYDVRDPKAYGVRVRSDSMVPRIQPGEIVIVSPNVPITNGDDVYVMLLSGERLIKRARRLGPPLGRATEGWLLESYNPAHEPRVVHQDEVGAMHKIVYIRPRRAGERVVREAE